MKDLWKRSRMELDESRSKKKRNVGSIGRFIFDIT